MKKPIDTENRFAITQEKITLAIQALIKTFDPIKSYTFGSYARGTYDEESDLDLMVVIESYNGQKPWTAASQGYGALQDIHMPVDLLVYDRENYDRCKDDPATFCYKIINKGKLLYEKNRYDLLQQAEIILNFVTKKIKTK